MRLAVFSLTLLFCLAGARRAASAKSFPQPSLYPISWQLDFKHGLPHRILVDGAPYWYMTYTVTNNTGQEQIWAPDFEMLTNDGVIVKSDHGVPGGVFDRIKAVEKNRFLDTTNHISGTLHQGPDQAKDGVAIWKEPNPRMGTFQIFVGGLSGEFVMLKDSDGKTMKDPDGQPVIVRKTMELDYAVYGDEFYPERHEVHELSQTWVMR